MKDRIPWDRPRAPKTPLKGLGDVVALAAQPIARAIDKVLGTDIEHCGGCAERRENLNRQFPIKPSDS